MGKAILFLVVVFIGVVVALVFMTGKAIAPTSDQKGQGSDVPADPLDPPNALRAATGKLGNEVKEKAKAAANAVIGDKITALTLDRDVVEVKAGTSTAIKVTRTGSTSAGKLDLIPAPNSGVKASGGEFKAGEAGTVVTIEVAAGTKADASVTIRGGDAVKVVPVKVK